MKRIINNLLTILLIVCFCFSGLTSSLAETSESCDIDSFLKLPSKFIAEPKIDIEAVIKDKVTEERVNENYEMGSLDLPENFTYDTSIYLVEYNVSTDYWDSVKTLDYKGLTDALNPDYPTIYIPLFSDILDSNGIMHTRVIGYIRLYYNVFNRDYSFVMSNYNVASEDYKNKEYVVFYEDIAFYLEENEINAQQIFLIKYMSSYTAGHETITVIQTESDTFILDLDNTLKIETDDKSSDRSLVYSIAEYKPLRQELEKELYQTVSSWEEIRFGGDVNDQPNDEKNTWIIFIPSIIAIMVALGTVIYFVLKKHRKHPSN